MQSGRAVERGYFEAGIVGKGGQPASSGKGKGLLARVLGISIPIFMDIELQADIIRRDEFKVQIIEQSVKLGDFALIVGGDEEFVHIVFPPVVE
jgi:hypothetical protein